MHNGHRADFAELKENTIIQFFPSESSSSDAWKQICFHNPTKKAGRSWLQQYMSWDKLPIRWRNAKDVCLWQSKLIYCVFKWNQRAHFNALAVAAFLCSVQQCKNMFSFEKKYLFARCVDGKSGKQLSADSFYSSLPWWMLKWWIKTAPPSDPNFCPVLDALYIQLPWTF